MSEHVARVSWSRGAETFVDNRYSRAHVWLFDGGASIAASASPQIVRPPVSDPAAVDPEEAFVAALSSCHMLWFLSLAAEAGLTVDSYVDAAVGTLEMNADGKLAITRVVLRPTVAFSGASTPTRAAFDALHEQAHAACFLASSVRTMIAIEAQQGDRPAGHVEDGRIV